MRCDPSPRSDLITRTGATAGLTGAAAGAVWGAAAAGAGAVCAAASGTPDSIVPANSAVAARVPNLVALITFTFHPSRRHLPSRTNWRARPALTPSTDQPGEMLPQPDRAQIVERHDQEKHQDCRQPATIGPFLDRRGHRPPPHRLDRVEQQMSSIEHRDWQ